MARRRQRLAGEGSAPCCTRLPSGPSLALAAIAPHSVVEGCAERRGFRRQKQGESRHGHPDLLRGSEASLGYMRLHPEAKWPAPPCSRPLAPLGRGLHCARRARRASRVRGGRRSGASAGPRRWPSSRPSWHIQNDSRELQTSDTRAAAFQRLILGLGLRGHGVVGAGRWGRGCAAISGAAAGAKALRLMAPGVS